MTLDKPKVIRSAVLALLTLGSMVMAEPTWAQSAYFPLQLGNWWQYQVYMGGTLSTVTATSQRVETVDGIPTTVVQETDEGGNVLAETYYPNSQPGISIKKVYMANFQGLSNVTATFDNPLALMSGQPFQGELLFTSGNAIVTVGGASPVDGASPMGGAPLVSTVPIFASFQVDAVDARNTTPGALATGAYVSGGFDFSGPPPFSGSLSFDKFFGEDLGPTEIHTDGLGPSQQVKMLTNTNVGASDPIIFGALLPTGGATNNGIVTAFAAIVNASSKAAHSCGIYSERNPDGSSLGAFSSWQTDPNNVPFGPADPLVDIAPGGVATFVFAFTPTFTGHRNVNIFSDCYDSATAQQIPGVNTYSLLNSNSPTASIEVVNSTLLGDGYTHVPTSECAALPASGGETRAVSCVGGTGVFAAAATNIGASDTITMAGSTLDPATPANVLVCESNPDASCKQPPASNVTVPWSQGQNKTFSVFVRGTGYVPDRPGRERVNLVASDQQGNTVGETGTALKSDVAKGTHTLTVEVFGKTGKDQKKAAGGSVKIDPPGTIVTFPDPNNKDNTSTLAIELYDNTTTVTLTATPDATSGSSFSTWGGDCSGNKNTCTVTVGPNDKSVTAKFTN